MRSALTSRPGAIAAVMVLAQRYGDGPGRVGVVVGIGAVLVVLLVGLLAANVITRVLKPVGGGQGRLTNRGSTGYPLAQPGIRATSQEGVISLFTR